MTVATLPDLLSSSQPAPGCEPARRRLLLGLAGGLLLLPQRPGFAQDGRRYGKPVTLSVIDRDNGGPLTVYRKDDRSFVAGRPGARYAIRVSNRTAERVLVVLSVDGVNVVSGETAAFGQTGYVLDPRQSFDVTGWRKSDTAVAAFEFAALAEAYAARTGRPGNVGVIGMAVFFEKPLPPPVVQGPPIGRDPYGRSLNESRGREKSAEAAPSAAPSDRGGDNMAKSAPGGSGLEARRQAQTEDRLGTAHGERERSVTRRTEFERLSREPQDVVEINYDSYPNLVAAGVIPRPQPEPRAFPQDERRRGFVPDPPPRY